MTKYILNSGGFRDKPDLAIKFFAEIVKGLGDKPYILVCAFAQMREDWEKNFAELKAHKEDLPIYALKEGEYVIFEQ